MTGTFVFLLSLQTACRLATVFRITGKNPNQNNWEQAIKKNNG
jgi:hypothetical protein